MPLSGRALKVQLMLNEVLEESFHFEESAFESGNFSKASNEKDEERSE